MPSNSNEEIVDRIMFLKRPSEGLLEVSFILIFLIFSCKYLLNNTKTVIVIKVLLKSMLSKCLSELP